MISPFQAHAMLVEQWEKVLGGGNELQMATLTINLNPPITVPCTHTHIGNDFVLLIAGKSSQLLIERCEFRASLIPNVMKKYVVKGQQCTLLVNQKSDPISLQLFAGGLMPGGEIYRFQLASINFGA